ncbi:trypsin-like peptidase domain-containing protein [Mucilaginibacter sp. UR6-1]|uniref:trypsin-like peptidase domain-containing protein n=1 Tax=Mucilaginibacter sp. UR6-1 TaxID=1435643 RepID=UPI001E42846F|nr:trypsin-like peptidase domain-containing protein [Mucilaginibacter sp. UR6-1]MCC8408185.1 trypsin-like peptidase domain-containing protein [Mucilaginibacter sp. UR6-1]
MKKIIIACYLLLLSVTVSAQKVDVKKLESTLQKAISSAYLPSVRMWGYDTAARQQMSAQFSGVVVSAGGYILTAAHVTIPGKTYKVMFADGREAIAMALGKIELATDRAIPDVALMQIITPGKWPYAPMATSSAIKVNEPCLSIAYPETLNQPKPTIRFGRITVVKNDRGFIQSTCKMEPGDSGGPLFDYLGRVIGIHSAINTDEDTNYEIPVDLYHKYWQALQKQQIYTTMPADSQAIAKDEIKDILTIPGLANMQVTATDLTKKLKLEQYLVNIISVVDTPDTRIYGTLVNVNNGVYIISKSSMVGDKPVAMLNGKAIPVKVIARDRQNDVVLLQINGTTPKGLKLPTTDANPPAIGRILVTPLQNKQGMVSISGSTDITLPRFWSLGYLGAAVGYNGATPELTFVQPNSPAAKSDLQVEDQVLMINNTEIKKNEDFGPVMQQYWPGDTLNFKILRKGQQYNKTVVLGKKQPGMAKHPAEMFKGGKSGRRDGFSQVFTHDAALLPEQCGSPVFDAQGNFAGINIARFSRTTTLALPVKIIQDFLARAIPVK